MRLLVPAIAVLVLSGATSAQAAPLALDDTSLAGKDRYERCLSLGRQSAARALGAATEWENAGGGAGALHCAAIALVSLKRYGEAAAKLDRIGRDPNTGNPNERSVLLDQAGNAWLLGGNPANAEASFGAALALTPNDTDILTDRARARGLRKNWIGADADLSTALSRDGNRADLLVLRASARHALGRKAEARADIDQALAVYANYPEALVERGVMKYESGDQAGARSDWTLAVSSAPGTAAAAAARQHLDDLAAQTAPASPPPKSGG